MDFILFGFGCTGTVHCRTTSTCPRNMGNRMQARFQLILSYSFLSIPSHSLPMPIALTCSRFPAVSRLLSLWMNAPATKFSLLLLLSSLLLLLFQFARTPHCTYINAHLYMKYTKNNCDDDDDGLNIVVTFWYFVPINGRLYFYITLLSLESRLRY